MVFGPPNSGKSFAFGSLMSMFPAVGYFRQVKGYTFNFDCVVGKQIICAEEFFLDQEKDHHTLETQKDMLSGNVCVVNYKQIPSVNVTHVPSFSFYACVMKFILQNMSTYMS